MMPSLRVSSRVARVARLLGEAAVYLLICVAFVALVALALAGAYGVATVLP